MWTIKNVLLVSVLALCFLVPVIGSAQEPTYQITDQELETLSTIFTQLDSKQKRQETLLNQQEKQLETLNTQLKTSQTEIESSRKAVETLQTSLSEANESLQKSAAEAKKTQKRIERQRDTWAAAAVLILAGVTFH